METLQKLKVWASAEWQKIPLPWRMEIVSCVHTFIATLAVVAMSEYKAGHVQTLRDIVMILGVTGLRAAWKAAATSFIVWLKNRE